MSTSPAFTWGVATAAYQIEGSVAADGRGPSIWDTFAHTPGRVDGGDTGDVACDHYRRWADDLDLVTWLGCSAYRFSLSWPRIQPDGRGRPEPRGLAFYDRLVDGLLERDVAPWATLYHWDLPQALEDDGGWANRQTASRFADYAAIVHDHLADRLAGVITLNEPWCSAFLGYAGGQHAPGRTDDQAAVAAAHHLMLGHGLAVTAMRAGRPAVPLGITLNVYPVEAASERPEDVDARRRIDGLANRIFLDPLLRGTYPTDVVDDLAGITDFAFVQPGDLESISQPLDFLGENYYSPYVVAASGHPDAAPDMPSSDDGHRPPGPTTRIPWPAARDVVFVRTGRPVTQMGWEVEPQGLERVLRRLTKDYDCPPLYVTENGAAYEDRVVNGQVDDPERAAYVADHVEVVLRAAQDGVDVRGYFVWSLLDNFEWGWGYSRRFGVFHVDFETQERTPKQSAHRYRELVGRRRES